MGYDTPNAPQRRLRMPDSDTWGMSCVAVCILIALGGIALLDASILTGLVSGFVIAIGVVFVGAGFKSIDTLRHSFFTLGAVLIVVAGVMLWVADYRYTAQLQPPRTRVIAAFWEAGSTFQVRFADEPEQPYTIYDRSAWPPVVGAPMCVTMRVPRVRRPTVERLKAGACDRSGLESRAPSGILSMSVRPRRDF